MPSVALRTGAKVGEGWTRRHALAARVGDRVRRAGRRAAESPRGAYYLLDGFINLRRDNERIRRRRTSRGGRRHTLRFASLRRRHIQSPGAHRRSPRRSRDRRRSRHTTGRRTTSRWRTSCWRTHRSCSRREPSTHLRCRSAPRACNRCTPSRRSRTQYRSPRRRRCRSRRSNRYTPDCTAIRCPSSRRRRRSNCRRGFPRRRSRTRCSRASCRSRTSCRSRPPSPDRLLRIRRPKARRPSQTQDCRCARESPWRGFWQSQP